MRVVQRQVGNFLADHATRADRRLRLAAMKQNVLSMR